MTDEGKQDEHEGGKEVGVSKNAKYYLKYRYLAG